MSIYRIYAASLSDYNAGILHGVWIDCDSKTAGDLNTEVQAMLAESPTTQKYGDIAEEYALHDYEGFGSLIGEYTPLSEVADIVEALESCDDSEALKEFAEDVGYTITEAAEHFGDCYHGQWDSKKEFAENFAEDTGMLSEVPENLVYYFDFDAFARDLFMEYTMTDSGYVFLR